MKIQRTFNGLPIREARASLHVQPSKADIAGATREDPTNCAYARCLKRTLNCTVVYVFKTRAYIQTLDERGRPVIERYAVKQYAREYLLRFDGGETVEPGGFVFHKPVKSITLDYKAEQSRKSRRSPHQMKGERLEHKAFSLRRGTGRVHFIGVGSITTGKK